MQDKKNWPLFLSILIAFSTWAVFCYLQPQAAPISDLVSTIKLYLAGAGAAFLALYQPPKPPSGGAS